MRLGYNTNGFTSHRFRDALEVIASLGFRSVAITLDGNALDPYEEGTAADAREIRTWLEERDVLPVVETGARFILDPWRKHWPTLLSPDPEARARRLDFLMRAIDVAQALDAPVVSLWSGTAETDEPEDVLDERLATGLRELCQYARERGRVIGFEPEPGMHVEDMDGYERIRALVDEPELLLTLDVGHAHMTEEDAAGTVRRYGGEIVNVHLEGMYRDRHEHLLPGEGDLDLAACIEALRNVRYQGPATLELSRHSHMAVEAAKRSLDFFRPLGLP